MSTPDHCRQARRRIESSFRGLVRNDDVPTRRVAREILGDRHLWLEEGVVRSGTP